MSAFVCPKCGAEFSSSADVLDVCLACGEPTTTATPDAEAEAATEAPPLEQRRRWSVVRTGLRLLVVANVLQLISSLLTILTLTVVPSSLGASVSWADLPLLAFLATSALHVIGQLALLAVPRDSELQGRACAMFLFLFLGVCGLGGAQFLAQDRLARGNPGGGGPNAYAGLARPTAPDLVLLAFSAVAFLCLLLNGILFLLFLAGIGEFFDSRGLELGAKTLLAVLVVLGVAAIVALVFGGQLARTAPSPDAVVLMSAGVLAVLAIAGLLFILLLVSAQKVIGKALRAR